MEQIAQFDPMNLIDIDETLSTAAEFRARYGWAPSGEELYRMQIRIGDRAYSTIAAYTPLGFVAWKVYSGEVTSVEFADFIDSCISPALNLNSIGVFDNASIHKARVSLASLERAFHGKYVFCPAYSPELKPIEKAFGLVKRNVRDNEASVIGDPVHLIHESFRLYSVHGERGSTG